MALKISSTNPRRVNRLVGTFIGILALLLQPLVPLNVPAVFAASIDITPANHSINGGQSAVSTLNATGYKNMTLSFGHIAANLEEGDDLFYGWREHGGVNHELGVILGEKNTNPGNIPGPNENGTKTVALPATAAVSNLEIYFVNTGEGNDTVEIKNITVGGDKIPVVVSALNAENFNTVDGNYKGISVGFNASNFGTVSDVTVTMERASGGSVVKKGNQGVRDLISNQAGPVKLTAPFVIQEGTFMEAGDTQYWQPAPAAWDSTTVPTKVIVSVTDGKGTKTVENPVFNQGAPSLPTYESLLVVPTPEDTEAPSVPGITTPVNEQYFKTTPILSEWSASTDNIGVVNYQVAYRYDDGHAFGGSTCEGMTIDGQAISGCRDTTSTSREHAPGNSEQGGVKIWVRAFDGAGNASGWSAPVHYYYDSTNPVLNVANLSEGDTIRTNNAGDKLTIQGDYSDNVQANYTAFYLIKDGVLKNTQMLNGAKPAGSTLVEFNAAALGLGDGEYSLQINATDMAGNISSQVINFHLDNTAPTVGFTAPANGTISNQAVDIRGTVTDSNLRHYWLEIKRDGAVIHSETVMTTAGFTDQLLGTVTEDGYYEVTMAALDTVGGTSSTGNRSADIKIGFTIDTGAPDAPSLQSPADNVFQNFNDFYFEWSDVSDAVEYEFQSSQNPSTDSNGALNSGVWNNKLNGGPDQSHLTESSIHSYGANGAWYWQVRSIDAAGNKSPWTAPWKVTIDMVAPDMPNILLSQDSDNASVAEDGSTNSESFTFSLGSSSDVTRYQLKYWNDIAGSSFKENTPWNSSDLSDYSPVLGTYKDKFTQGEGTHYFSFSACDAAGNCSAYSAPFVVTYDITTPVLTLNSVPNSTGTSRTISGVSDPFANIVVTVHSTPQTKTTVADASGNWSLFFEGLEVGRHTVRVISTDASGNISEQISTFTVFSLAPVAQPFIPLTLAVLPTPQPTSQGLVGDTSNVALTEQDEEAVALSDDTAVITEDAALSAQSGEASTPLADTDVLGTTTDDTFFGLAWYWWLVAPAALVGGWLLLAAVIRRSRKQEV